MLAKKRGIYWFTNDLRLHDNPALAAASIELDEMVCIYVIDTRWQHSSLYPAATQGVAAKRFQAESLADLRASLSDLGQELLVLSGSSEHRLGEAIEDLAATHVFRSENVGWYENRSWESLRVRFPEIEFRSIATHTLFEEALLPFAIADLPSSFTKFKNAMSDYLPSEPEEVLNELPVSVLTSQEKAQEPAEAISGSFRGGETAGLQHLGEYFATNKPSCYKEVRNALDGWDNSSKLSPWLANGCLSVRQVYATLKQYEDQIEANESTYWIYFELLWREYFQWYALKHGADLYKYAGIKNLAPLNSFYPERFQKWVNGNTPFPLVNACMNELRATGFLSNRGRQVVASCFVNELAMDWRYGAAYFEQVLIDYDVASNWGNWQYLAGVGADTRGKRHFNLDKQAALFDPAGDYVQKWRGAVGNQPLDSVDAADWPIS